MGDLDGETIEWLNGLRLGDKLSYVSDFENGYYLGVIFERMNLSKGRKFKNTNDMACKFQNFKNVRDLLYENFKVEFPIQNILYNTDSLLRTVRDCFKKYNRDKKQATLRRISTFSESKIRPEENKLFASRQKDILMSSKMNQTAKLPKKIQDIEHKLEKYREIKTKHELMALEDRKREIEDNRRLVEEHRLFELSKVRANHQFTREHEKKVYDVWMKTEQIKRHRIQKDNNLKSFLEEKKSKLYQSLRQEQINSINDGIEAFQMNCIRQGIELEHDPDKALARTEEHFNKQVVMERIKDNIKIHEKEHKDRLKRENKKNVDAKEANLKAEKIWQENSLIEQYAKKMNEHIKSCEDITKRMNREQAEKKIIVQRYKNREFAELPPANIDEQKRKQDYRVRMMKYREEEIVRLQKRQKELRTIGQHALDALIHIVVCNEQLYYADKGFCFSDWTRIEREFIQYQKKEKQNKNQNSYFDQSYQTKAIDYVQQQGEWTPEQAKQQPTFQLSPVLQTLISKAYPPASPPPPTGVPLYMPLKLAFVGNRLSGKSTMAQQIAIKYGTPIINPQQIINQAFELNKEPVVEDPKKKKDSKKPEEESPQKVALKRWGQGLMRILDSPSSANIEHFIEAIDFKLRYHYQNKTELQISQEFQQSRNQEAERYNKAVKDFEQAQKKGKKDSKKAGGESEEPPAERKYFYTKGFIIDGIDLSLQTVKEIQRKINGFICFEETINKTGEETKEQLSNVIPLAKAQKDPSLKRGFFDLLIHLDSSAEALQSRQPSEKIQLANLDYTELKSFYSNFGNEGTKMTAFQVVSNDGTVEDCLSNVSKIIQSHLDRKYEEILAARKGQTQGAEKEVGAVSEARGKQEIKQQERFTENEGQVEANLNNCLNKQQLQQQNQKISQPGQPKPVAELIQRLSQPESSRLVAKFVELFRKYRNNVSLCFSDLDSLRSDFGKTLLSIQQSFVSIINRPDDKAGKILNFQENYNKLLSEKTNIVKDTEASRHLTSKLDELNDAIWLSIERKKNEAVAEREKVLKSSTLNSQVKKLVEVIKKLCENQLTLLVEVVFFIYNLNSLLQGSKEEIPTEYLVLGIPPHLEPILSFEESEFVSDRLDYYTKQTKACIEELPAWLKKREKKFKIVKSQKIDSILGDFVEQQTKGIICRLEQIRAKAKEMYLQYYCFFRALTNKMDDWIIQGIKHENEFVYEIFKNIRKHILEAKKSAVKDLFARDITDVLHPISSLPPSRLPVLPSTPTTGLKVLSFLIFVQEIKCLSTGGRIPFKVFKAYFQKRKKSKWLETEFLQLQLDIMQQYLVTDEYCNYREVALAMLLWRTKILDQDAINEYNKLLCGVSSTETTENYQFYKEELTFGEFQIMPCICSDKVEERILKAYIYEIFRQEYRERVVVKELIDTLRLFNQLQVYRYGDTLMILHEGGGKHYDQIE